jgi:hypothetical protein
MTRAQDFPTVHVFRTPIIFECEESEVRVIFRRVLNAKKRIGLEVDILQSNVLSGSKRVGEFRYRDRQWGLGFPCLFVHSNRHVAPDPTRSRRSFRPSVSPRLPASRASVC